jgi:hypothetical protein
MLSQSFNLLSEYWIPTIIKQVAVKIQVISSSADAAIRIVVASTHIGYNKLVPIFVEQCGGKNAKLRKHCLEYLMFACSLWSQDTLDKHASALYQTVRNGVMDADQHARKAARQLFWVMMNREPWSDAMSAMLNDLEPSQQKHIHSELQSPSPELQRSLYYLHSYPWRSQSLAMTIYSHHVKDSGYATLQSAALDNKDTAFARPRSVARGQSARTLQSSQSAASLQSVARPKSSSMVKRATSRFSLTPSYESSFSSVLMKEEEPISPPGVPPDAFPDSLPAGPLSSRRSSLAAPMRVSQTRSMTSLQPRTQEQAMSSTTPKDSVLMSSTEFLALSSAGQSQAHAVPIPPTRVSTSSTSSSREFAVPAPPSASSLGSGAKRVAIGSTANDKGELPRNLPLRSQGSATGIHDMKAPTLRPQSALLNKPAEATLTRDVITTQYANDSMMNRKADNQSTGSGYTTLSGKSAVHVIDMDDGKSSASNDPSDSSSSFTADNLRTLAADEFWGNRVKAFDLILKRLQLAGNDADLIPVTMIDLILDLSVDHMADPHQKIATESMQILQYFIDHPSFASKASAKLSHFIGALFHRLADRRQSIRDHANDLLNSIRQTYDPIAIMTALAPKIVDVPTRIRTAVMQFLGAIVPHCESYFLQQSNTAAFLNRMSMLLGGSGANKPSVTLTVAGRRLLELVYKVAPREVSVQLSLLPLQPQYILKKLLEVTIPDIDNIVARYVSSMHSSTAAATATVQPKPALTQRNRPDIVIPIDPVGSNISHEHVVTPKSEEPKSLEIDFYADAPSSNPSPNPANKENIHSPNSVLPSPMTPPPATTAINSTARPSSSKSVVVAENHQLLSPLSRELSTEIVVVLTSLYPSTSTDDKVQAVQRLRQLIKDEVDDAFWSQYTSQVAPSH